MAFVKNVKTATMSLLLLMVSSMTLLTGCGPGVADSGSCEGESKYLDSYSWEKMSEISQEISQASSEDEAIAIAKKYKLCTSDGKLDGTQVKSVQLTNGIETCAQIVGFWHDDKTDGGKAGITFIFKDAISKHAMNPRDSNDGGWRGSELRRWLDVDAIEMLPEDLNSNILSVDKHTNNVGETNDVSSVSVTSDRLWLFSVVEIYGNAFGFSDTGSSEVAYAEGDIYMLFDNGNNRTSVSDSVLVKDFKGNLCQWWCRTPHPITSVGFCMVNAPGESPLSNNASVECGVVPGFCI